MAPSITRQESQLLRDLIEQQSGIRLGEDKEYLLETRLPPLLREAACRSYGELCRKARTGTAEGRRLCRRVVDAVTTNETSWFRDGHPFRILRERILPELDREIDEGRRRKIRIWSAGCSTGQEPYSVALTALDFYRVRGGDGVCRERVEILGTDISETVLAHAREAEYRELQVNRGLSAEHRERYFRQRGRSWRLVEAARDLVAFQVLNLRDPFRSLGPFDVVFFRNVAIYFSEEFRRAVLESIRGILAPGGYLLLGATESAAGAGFRTDGAGSDVCYRVPPAP